ncbi:MAG: glutaredoxin [Actinomycetota bacterium]|nr:glutaredoxin [Actinomycetota bacterium]
MATAGPDRSRRVEVFSAGCPTCRSTIEQLRQAIDPRHEVVVLDMHDADVAGRADGLDIRTVPAVVVDGSLLSCCKNTGPTRQELQAAGLTKG